MAVSQSELKAIVKITGEYETGGLGYGMVAGDFDGQGISCGILQWNIGQGSLQPLVLSVGQNDVLKSMPKNGRDLWRAANSSISTGLSIVRSWQVKSKLIPTAKAELKALMTSDPMVAEQDKGIARTAIRAEREADAWASAKGGGGRTVQEMAFFFDVATQNGGSAGLTYADVQTLKNSASPDRVDDLICDWLTNYKKTVSGYGDGLKNVSLWRNKVTGDELDLLILAYMRANKANSAWRIDVMNRKGTIATKRGWVHKELVDLTSVL